PGSRSLVPASGTANWTTESTSASTSAKCPISTVIFARPFLSFRVLPQPALLQPVGDLLRHIGLVVLGEHAVGLEDAAGPEFSFRHPAPPPPEEVGQYARKGDGNRALHVGDRERHRCALAAHHRALLHQPAEADALAGLDRGGGQIGRHEEVGGPLAERI